MDQPSWISTHIQRWGQKPQLRYFYEQEIFRRIAAFSNPKGVLVEIGCGPGFLKSAIPNMICTDIENGPTVDCLVDATQLPFKNNSVDAFIGVDVLHHFDQPGGFFKMASRSLKPGGRIIFVEPWAGSFGHLFYRFVHHEDCVRVETPFGPAFTGDKSPMDGNAMIARQCLVESETQLRSYGFKTMHRSFFGCFSYLLTGGFQPWSVPKQVIALLLKIEKLIPQPLMRIIGVRMMVVLERI